MKCARLVAVMLALAVLLVRAEQMKFDAPRANGYRVDACRAWGQGCGKDAADAFCRLHNFESASAFEIDPRIGAKTPTMTIEDKKICNQPQCDGFKSITCTRADAPAGRRRVPPGLIDAITKAGGAKPQPATPPPATEPPAPPPPRTPAPRTPRNPALAARLDPAEFVILKPKSGTATLGLFGSRAYAGELETVRKVEFPVTPDLVQPGVADVNGDGQSDLLLLETANPSKPDESQLRFLTVDAELGFVSLALTGVNVGKTFPLLASGRLVRGGFEQALVYAPGEEAVVIGWRAAPSTEVAVDYIKIPGWRPKGILMVLDADGDGQDDILDYSESGSLDLVTLGQAQGAAAGEGSTDAAVRPLLTLGPGHEFGLGDFTGDGRADLLIRDKSTLAVSLAQFDAAGAIRSRTPIAANWPASWSWTRGADYDGDGSDDLLVFDTTGGSTTLVRFTNQGTLRDTKLISSIQAGAENLRFAGYFMGSGRSSYLSHVRSDHQILHVWLATIDPVPALGPVNVLVQNVPEGALVVVGNFRKGR